MSRKFGELRAKLSPESRARSEARARKILDEMALADVRNTFGMSQQQVAISMKVNQPAVAKIERRSDALVSTLRDYVGSFGGKLRLVAEFPQGSTELLLAGQAPASLTGTFGTLRQHSPASKIKLNSIERMPRSEVHILPKIVGKKMSSAYETTAVSNSNDIAGIWVTAFRNSRPSAVSNVYVGS